MRVDVVLAITLDRDSDKPLFEQLCQGVRRRAIEGELKAGTRLPPSRSLAIELGISRSTVVMAYEQLVAEGYLSSVQGSGYTLTDIGGVELASQVPKLRPVEAVQRERPVRITQADMQLFPHKQWAARLAKICRSAPQRLLQGGEVFGDLGLRRAVADHLAQWRGFEVSPERVIICAGASDALELSVRTLCRLGDCIALEEPGYLPLRSLIEALGMQRCAAPIDEQGAQLPPPQAKLAVLTPSHQYPLGGAMSPQRRLQFIAWAQRQRCWLIEDDYDSEFRYAGRPIPALASLDAQRTLYIGSFSKVFASHLRLGYLVVPQSLCERFAQSLQVFAPKASYLPQPVLADYIDSGDFYRHLRRVRRAYDLRRQYLLEQLQTRFTVFGEVIDHRAGMQLVFTLFALSDAQVARAMGERGFEIAALSSFYAGSARQSGLVIGFSGIDSRVMAQLLDALYEVLTQLV
ncbi:MAG: PLP-dependent aminotransferase family protein [Pseudomonadales bacterium]